SGEGREQGDREQVRHARRCRAREHARRHRVADELEPQHGDRGDEHDVPHGHVVRRPSTLVTPTTIATTAAASTGSPGGSQGTSTAATTTAATATATGCFEVSRGHSRPRNAAAAARSEE